MSRLTDKPAVPTRRRETGYDFGCRSNRFITFACNWHLTSSASHLLGNDGDGVETNQVTKKTMCPESTRKGSGCSSQAGTSGYS